ncbi:MAG: putative prokaryotic signal transducing protein [Verrucomicrobiota bacterium]
MKTIATLWKSEEAHLLRLRLGRSCITAYLQDENTTQIHPWRAAAIGGVRVQVADSDVENALQILREGAPLAPCRAPAAESNVVECCACGGSIPAGQSRCLACGWSYCDGVDEAERDACSD